MNGNTISQICSHADNLNIYVHNLLIFIMPSSKVFLCHKIGVTLVTVDYKCLQNLPLVFKKNLSHGTKFSLTFNNVI